MDQHIQHTTGQLHLNQDLAVRFDIVDGIAAIDLAGHGVAHGLLDIITRFPVIARQCHAGLIGDPKIKQGGGVILQPGDRTGHVGGIDLAQHQADVAGHAPHQAAGHGVPMALIENKRGHRLHQQRRRDDDQQRPAKQGPRQQTLEQPRLGRRHPTAHGADSTPSICSI